MKENVVQAVLQFLSAETLYRNLCVPIRMNDRMANQYQLTLNSFPVYSSFLVLLLVLS